MTQPPAGRPLLERSAWKRYARVCKRALGEGGQERYEAVEPWAWACLHEELKRARRSKQAA